MKIAILGWGSLIWQPKELKYNKEFGWNKKGPFLPIEFSRISNNGRLTLVIDKSAENIPTLYATSANKDLDLAILNLASREGCALSAIGYYIKKSKLISPVNFSFSKEIENWIKETDYDAVVWTNLGKKFKDKTELEHNPKNAIKYLESLPGETKVVAEDYVRKAPQQIKTLIRKEIEEKLGWTYIEPKINE